MSTPRQFVFNVVAVDTSLPSWVPTTIGESTDAGSMTNTLDSIRGTGTWRTNSSNKLADYSGGCFNRYYSPHGAMIVHGGGHAADQDNGVYACNFSTLLWEKAGASTDLNDYGRFKAYTTGTSYDYFIRNGPNSTDWASGTTTYAYDSGAELPNNLSNPREIVQDQPGSAHTYDSLICVPVGTRGSLVRISSAAVGRVVSADTTWAHRFAFDSSTWGRYGSTQAPNGGAMSGAAAAYDTTRNVIWRVPPGSQTAASRFDVATTAWLAGGTASTVPGYIDNNVACYHATRDIVVQALSLSTSTDSTTPAGFYWYNAATGSAVRTAVTWTNGSGPTHGNYGRNTIVDIPALGKMFYFSRWNPTVYYLITVPADPAQPWTWETVTITGTARPDNLAAPEPAGSIYHRMDYAPALKSIVWVTGRTGVYDWGSKVLTIRIHS